ncbi:hypothetical protein [Aquipuribacter nitratireducens]|uniref:Uncharacterized protein n=1 Tax=Aquipuribacter nitratireducens TaxID=650104 RepID=A0ABW0GJ47_9MICO
MNATSVRRAAVVAVTLAVAAACVVLLGATGWLLAVEVLVLGVVVDLSLLLRAERRAAAARHRAREAARRASDQQRAATAESLAETRSGVEALDRRLDALADRLAEVAAAVREVGLVSDRLETGLRRVDDQCVSLRLEVDRATAAIADRAELLEAAEGTERA